jgi:hypothetical protein
MNLPCACRVVTGDAERALGTVVYAYRTAGSAVVAIDDSGEPFYFMRKDLQPTPVEHRRLRTLECLAEDAEETLVRRLRIGLTWEGIRRIMRGRGVR